MVIPLFVLADPPLIEPQFEPWDDEPWDVFIPDEDERDPHPEHGDFWSDDLDQEVDEAYANQQEDRPCCL